MVDSAARASLPASLGEMSRYPYWDRWPQADAVSVKGIFKGEIALSFRDPEGCIRHVRFSEAGARFYHALLGEILQAPGTNVQSAKSSGSPRSEGSPQDGQMVAPATRSSSAAGAE